MKLKFAALLLLISVGAFSQNKIVLTAPRLDTSSLSNRINLKANTSLNNVNGVLSSTYGGAGSVSGILKANGSGLVEPAVNNSDYTLLNGTGFVRMSGTTPSYLTGASTSFVKADGSLDGNTYATTGALSGYLPLSGGTLSGSLTAPSYIISGSTPVIIYTVGDNLRIAENGTGANPMVYSPSTGALSLNGALSGTSLSMSGEGLFGGAVTNGVDKLRVAGSGLFTSTIKGTNGGLLLQNSAANSNTIGLIIEGTYPWQKYIDTESAQESYGEYIDGGTFYAKRVPYADRNSAIASVGTDIYTLNLSTGAITASSSVTAGGILKGVGFNQAISLKTSNYTLTSSDYTVFFNTTSGNLTATLPAGVEGRIYNIGYSVLANQLTIVPNGSETINGDTSFIINSGACYQTVTLQFLSGNWYILSTAYNQSCL